MTYCQLIRQLSNLTNDKLDNDVTVYSRVEDEYYPARSLNLSTVDCDVLDEGHPFIVVG